MLINNTDDIVKMATSLAGIEDVNYMKHSTITQILNSEFSSLYELLIQNNDEAFTKKKTYRKSEAFLPDDFYKLRSVKTDHNLDTTEYNIINNKIIFTDDVVEHTIQYWVNPPTLTYQAEIQYEISGDTVYDALGDRMITVDGIENIATHSVLEDLTDPENYHLTPDDYVYSNTIGAIRYSNGFTKLDEHIPVAVTAYADINGKYAYYIKREVDETTHAVSYKYYRYDMENGTTEPSDYVIFTLEDGHTLKIDGSFIYADGIKIYQKKSDKIVPVKFDIGTGYGFMVDGYSGTDLYPITVSTQLDFPSSLHYTVLAYRLAVAMCIILGKDPSGLQLLSQQKERQLVEQVRRNLSGVSRIKNVYNYIW